jgi:hypothetical protein
VTTKPTETGLSATIVVEVAGGGRRGLHNGRLYVPDLPTALQLASRRGGVIQLSAGDYFPPADKGYFDIRLHGPAGSNNDGRLIISGSSPGTVRYLFISTVERYRYSF